MTNRITGDRLIDWLRWLVRHQLIDTVEAHDAIAGVVDIKLEQLKNAREEPDSEH